MEEIRKLSGRDLILRMDFVGRHGVNFTYRYFIKTDEGEEFQCYAKHKDAYERVLRCIRGEEKFKQKNANLQGYTYRQALLTLYCDGLVQNGRWTLTKS